MLLATIKATNLRLKGSWKKWRSGVNMDNMVLVCFYSAVMKLSIEIYLDNSFLSLTLFVVSSVL